MIKMAESRGLFGANIGENIPSKKQKPLRTIQKTSAKTKRKTSFEIERIAAQTHASMMRSFNVNKCCNCDALLCPRHPRLESKIAVSPARQWWNETTRYLTNLKKSLIKQKIISKRPQILQKLLPDNDKILRDINNIDEILNKLPKTSGTCAKIPVYPKLRLTRNNPNQRNSDRIPFPVYNCSIELPVKTYI